MMQHCYAQFGLLMLLAGGTAHLFALTTDVQKGTHPVSIAGKRTENTRYCLGCHKDLQKPFMHSALKSGGCTACHQVFSEQGNTRVTLSAEGNTLCLQCHSDKQPANGQVGVHPPLEGECASCHDPHSSTHPNQLPQATSGGPEENLCLTCHEIGTAVPTGGSRHPALDLGCDSCHATHKSGDARKPEFAFHLVAAPPELCTTCHDPGDEQLQQAHRKQPFAKADCFGCHEPHASEQAKLIHKFAHPPFAERMCEACHEKPNEEQVVLLEGGSRELCFTCHDDLKSRIASATQPHGLFEADESCTTCHSPHATRYEQHLQQPQQELCEGCHSDRAEERATKKFLHKPAFQTGCSVCHEPHASDFAARLRAPVSEVCLSCHGRQSPRMEAGQLLLFAGTVQLPQDYLANVKRIPVRAGEVRGHPMKNHPVAGVADPSAKGRDLSCVSCHDAHAGEASARRFVTGTKSETPLCVRCH